MGSSYMRTWKRPNSSWSLSQAAPPSSPCPFCIHRGASLYVHCWLASLQKSTWHVVDTHTFCQLNEWMKWKQKHDCCCSCVFSMQLPLPDQKLFEDEDPILPAVRIQSTCRQLAICVYLWDPLNAPHLHQLGLDDGVFSMLSHTRHTHPEIVELRRCRRPVPKLQGTPQVWCWRFRTSDKAKPMILVWRCLWDIFPTIFFNQAVLLLRNLQCHARSSRKKYEILALGVIHKLAPASHLGPSPLTPLFPFSKVPPLLLTYQDIVFTPYLPFEFTLMSLFSPSLSLPHCTQPSCDHTPSICLSEIFLDHALWLPHHLSFGISMVSSLTCRPSQHGASDAPYLRLDAHRKPVLTPESSAHWGQDHWLSTPLPGA